MRKSIEFHHRAPWSQICTFRGSRDQESGVLTWRLDASPRIAGQHTEPCSPLNAANPVFRSQDIPDSPAFLDRLWGEVPFLVVLITAVLCKMQSISKKGDQFKTLQMAGGHMLQLASGMMVSVLLTVIAVALINKGCRRIGKRLSLCSLNHRRTTHWQ